jgi:TIR domain
MQNQPKRIFISYSRSDWPFVCHLSERLRSVADVVLDLWILYPGDDWLGRISEAIGSVDVVMVVVSRSSVQSVNVMSELEAASAAKLAIWPIILEDAESVPDILSSRHWIDARHSPMSAIEKIVVAVERSDSVSSGPFRRRFSIKKIPLLSCLPLFGEHAVPAPPFARIAVMLGLFAAILDALSILLISYSEGGEYVLMSSALLGRPFFSNMYLLRRTSRADAIFHFSFLLVLPSVAVFVVGMDSFHDSYVPIAAASIVLTFTALVMATVPRSVRVWLPGFSVVPKRFRDLRSV